ncbi:MAG: FAD-binding protein [Coriobacteriia bacterium]|nr:FAD-binding protein [Coriobacteriia bacterium]
MEVSRRTFLKGAALGAVGVATIGSVGALTGCSSTSTDDSKDTYTASAKGCHGDITATAVIKSGAIKSLKVTGPLETPSIGGLALEGLPKTIVEKNSLAVDAVSGATLTSVAILKATAYCMSKAGVSVKVTPAAQNYKAGTYSATYKGHMGPVTVKVTFSANKIDKIELGTHTETPSLVNGAFNQMSAQIIADQSLGVDSVTTATYSSRAIMSGVADCVKQAGGDPAGLKRPLLSNPTVAKDEETTADIVIVGGGTSGSVALTRAATSGLKAICVESAPVVGGMGEISGFASMSWFGSKMQKTALNITDAAVEQKIKEQTISYFTSVVYQANEKMIQNACRATGPMVDMLADAGMTLKVASATGITPPIKGERFQGLHAKAASLGSQTLRNHRVDKLLVDDAGKISGVVATRKDGSHLTIKTKAVVLCSGGACANQQMMIDMFPDYPPTMENCAISSDDGAGLWAAWNAGATKAMFGVHGHNHTLPLTAKLAGISTVEATDDVASLGNIPLLWLNREGRRWCDETKAFGATPGGNVMLFAQKGFNVLDQATVDAMIKSGTLVKPWRGIAVGTPLTNLAKQLSDGEKTGFVYKADTIEALAAKTGWNSKVAKEEVAKYNAIINAKVDPDYYRDPAYLKYTIETGPFYAVELRPRCLGSFGGLLMTADYEVCKDNGSPLPGLYAAGDVSCGWFGRSYPDIGGLTSWHNTVSGYVATTSAIKYLKG